MLWCFQEMHDSYRLLGSNRLQCCSAYLWYSSAMSMTMYNILFVVEMFWPDVSKHRQQNHGPLVLSASHTSTIAEQLSSVLGILLSLPRTRHIVTQYITNQLDSITHLISHTFSSPSLPAVSISGFFGFTADELCTLCLKTTSPTFSTITWRRITRFLQRVSIALY